MNAANARWGSLYDALYGSDVLGPPPAPGPLDPARRDAVVARAELARWLDRADFPSTGPELVEAARDHRAPEVVVEHVLSRGRGL